MKIYDYEIGRDKAPFFIAEIGANHDGSLERALRLIELAADAGADAVKFQHFDAATIVSERGFMAVGQIAHQASWGKSVYATYDDAAIPREWTEHLSSYAHDHGMAFITTPYSIELADFVEPYVDAYKIGSGDITYIDLIAHVARKRKPWLLATGASNSDELKRVARHVFDDRARLPIMLQCNTNYTGDDAVNLSHQNLRVLDTWQREYGTLMGLSDHTHGHLAVCTAIALGACVIEKHFTDDPQRSGPDHAFATTPFEWRAMMNAADTVWLALGDGVKRIETNELESVIVQRRALRYAPDRPPMAKGTLVLAQDVVATRPCLPGALEPSRVEEVLGRSLRRGVEPDTLVRLEDFE